MKIEEMKEITKKIVEKTIVGRKCDICGKEIKPNARNNQYNYFALHTWHNDWGNDSCESHEYMDACSPECVKKFTDEYIKDAFENFANTHEITVSHVRTLYAPEYL